MIVAELQYFPPVSFVSVLFKESYIYIDLYETYRKMSFRNRCLIAGAEGIISLSIPLEDGRNQQLPLNEVLISGSEKWQQRHFRSLHSAYSRSPFFEYYRDELEVIFKQPYRRLADWNLYCLDWLSSKIKWPAEIRYTETAVPYQKTGTLDLRDLTVPKNYQQKYPLRYRQVFEERTGFFPNLSILDLLFNAGPAVGELLMQADH